MVDYTNLMRIEYTILGTVLYEPDHVGEVIAKLSPENFSMESTRGLFNAISALHFEGAPVDPVTMWERTAAFFVSLVLMLLSLRLSIIPWWCW